ncbi:MAG: pilus assembly protein N-terminal domain-containing protein [Candidatus Sumerlaeota bacterium]
MKRHTFSGILTLLLIACLMMSSVLVSAQNDDESVASGAVKGGQIELLVGRSHVLKDVDSFEIANPSVVTAQPAQNGDLILKGSAPGETTVLVRKTGLLGLVQYDVRVQATDIEETLRTVRGALGGILGLVIRQEGNVIVLEGEITNRADAMRLDRQKEFFGKQLIDLTEREEIPQIEVDVEVYTIDMADAKAIGDNSLLEQITTVASSGWSFQTGPDSTVSYPQIDVGSFETKIRALVTDSSGTNVSKQHASVRAGQTATIRNTQTEYIPIAGGLAATLEEIEVGQILNIKPNFTNNNRFETTVDIELSEIGTSSSGNVTAARRQINSTYISSPNEKVVLGGTTRQSTTNTEGGTPFLRHIPILGKLLFQRKVGNQSEIAQIFFMTLRAPNTFEADDERQSEKAIEQRERVKSGAEKDNEYTKPGKWQ